MAKGDDLQDRRIDFAVMVLLFSVQLPGSAAGQHIAGQLLRSGTSPAPNDSQARAAESRKDFVHTTRVALKELNETKVWLDMLPRSGLAVGSRVDDLHRECDELCRIRNASVITASRPRARGTLTIEN